MKTTLVPMKSTTVDDLIDVPAKRKEPKSSAEPARQTSVIGRARAFQQRVAAALGTAAATPWSWVVVTCLILGIAGGTRYWREYQFYDINKESRNSPFPLAELPRLVGEWRLDEGLVAPLDPEIARFAGASDHITRQYTNIKNGETAVVLVVYGLASAVTLHTPDVCYPAAGYRVVATESKPDHELKIQGVDKTAIYRQGFYAKSFAGRTEYAEAVYSFRHAGDWLPDAATRWKAFRYRPGVFKVQVGRTVTDLTSENNASVDLLGEFMREIELRLDSDAKAASSAVGPNRQAAVKKAAN